MLFNLWKKRIVFVLLFPFSGCWCISIEAPKQQIEIVQEDGGLQRENILELEPLLPCQTGDRLACDTGKPGVCKKGEMLCDGSQWSLCKQVVEPSTEVCDGFDNDCDGLVDEQLVRKCPYSGPIGTENQGPCKAGTQTCQNGQWQKCVGEILPQPEKCDGKDNDCNGAIDEWLPVQQVSQATVYSNQGESSHIHLTSIPDGYAFAWSERFNREVKVTRLDLKGKRLGSDWTLTSFGNLGNIHGFAWTGKEYFATWDSDQQTVSDAFISKISPTGKTLIGPQVLAKGGKMVNPQVAYGNGFLGVLWSDYKNNLIFAQTMTLDLKPLGSISSFTTSNQLSPYPGLTFLGDTMAITYINAQSKIHLIRLDKQGKQVGTTTILSQSGVFPVDVSVASVIDGFLVVWTEQTTQSIYVMKVDKNGKEIGSRQTISSQGKTPIIKSTSFGGLLAWIQTENGREGVSIVRVDTNGKMLAKPSWFRVTGIQDYLALAWTDEGQGQGRGAIAWINQQDQIQLAPLGCVAE